MSAVRLGDNVKLIRGITFKPVDKCDPHDEGTVVCMRTKNVQATLDASDLIAVPRSLVTNSEKMLSTGDILVSSANSWNLVGKCCRVPKLQYPSTAGAFISILRPKTEKLESSYLYRWFSSDEIQRRLRSFANQTTNISNLNHKKTLELQIPLPPLAEQKRIAAILDAADALRAKRREALAQLDTLLQSTFLDMFGDPVTNPMEWEKPRLEGVCKKVIDCPHSTPRWTGSGVVCLRTSNLGKGEWNWADTRFVAEKDYTERTRRSEVLPNDIILSREGTVGVLALVDEGMRLCMGQRLVQLRVNDSQLDPRFLLNLLLHNLAPERLSRLMAGSTSKHLNVKELRKLPVLLPPLDIQHRFSAIAESVEQQKTRQRAHLAELDTLFASLQSRAFRGNL